MSESPSAASLSSELFTESLSAEHERLGQLVTAMIARYAGTLDGVRVCSEATPGELEKLFDEPLPLEGSDAVQLLERFSREVVPHAMHIPSPRYYGLFNPTPLPIGVWADALASAINQNGAAWRNSPSASVIEARVLRWLCEIVGFGAASFGTLTSGGSEANLIALKCARDRAAAFVRDEGMRAGALTDARAGDPAQASATSSRMIVYASEQCHYSFEKCVDILGLGRRNLRKVATDERFHLRPDLLRSEIERDLEAGHLPICIAGAAGTTSTGVIDPLADLADLAREYKLWFHVDGAYGGALAMSEKYKSRLKGIERADSVTLDPHKWMFVPFAAGAVLMREGGGALRAAFDITPEYLSEEREGGADVAYDFFRYGQLGTRRFNALKVWFALKTLGVRGYARIIEQQIELANYLAARISESDDFECVGEVETAVCCLRFVPSAMRNADGATADSLQRELQQRIERSGEAWLSTTVLHGRRALRVNINSFLTERRHMDDLLELLRRESRELLQARKP